MPLITNVILTDANALCLEFDERNGTLIMQNIAYLY